MRNFLRNLSRKRFPYEPLITIEISKSALLGNLNRYKSLAPNGRVAPVLKSNAYGHGLFEIAYTLRTETVIPFFCVDSYFEAVALHARGFRTPILVIGYTRPDTISACNLKQVAFAVTSLDTLKNLKNNQAKIHLKLDTGMHRQGLLPNEAEEAIQILKFSPRILLDGIFTHFADADNPDKTFTLEQIAIWNAVAKKFKTALPNIEYFHASNTDGSLFTRETESNVNRLGIGLYRNVMEVKTIITGVKKLNAGETVGYGNTFMAQKNMTIATIPVGYYEGLDRRLSNNGFVEVGPERIACPIIGRISMNIATLDVSAIPNIKINDEVIVVSRDPNTPNSMQAHATRAGTIDYEMYVRIPAHLKRNLTD